MEGDIVIEKVYTANYFEFARDSRFEGECGNFLKLIYVDKGNIIFESGNGKRELLTGNAILCMPGERICIYCDGISSANVAEITFECEASCMSLFEGKVICVTEEQKRLISGIITEYTNAYLIPPGITPPVGAGQLIRQYLCEFLILTIRQNTKNDNYIRLSENGSNATVDMVVEYMRNNISEALTMDELSEHCGAGGITVNRLFRKFLNTTPMKYFINLKIDMAKKYLRENNYNVTQIAEMLGYANIHYFSRQFKCITGMSPTEYVGSIKAISDRDEKQYIDNTN